MSDRQLRAYVLGILSLSLLAVSVLSLTHQEPKAGTAPILYTVQPGDTLKGVATCLGQSDVDWRAIVSVIEDENPSDTAQGIQAGSVLYIPASVTGGAICKRMTP